MTEENADSKIRSEAIASAIDDPEVPKLYANGFVIGIGNADVHIALQRTGKPVGFINLSYTTAKTLQRQLAGLLAKLESATGQEMLTTQDVDEALQSYTKSGLRGYRKDE